MEKEVLVGYISNYIYTSQDSLYKVCSLVCDNDEEITIVGNFPRLEDGLNYEFVGQMKEHPKYGRQFFVESYAKSKSFTKDGLIHYLSSDKFYGIGQKLATNIVDKLGLDCINIIMNEPERLDDVSGLSKAKKDIIISTIKDNYAQEQLFIRLYGFGLSPKMIQKLYDRYGDKAANVIEENPYILIYEVEGFGFKKSDALAMNLGFKEDDIRRIKAAISYTITYVCYQQGFTFLSYEQTISSAKNLLNNNLLITDELCVKAINELVEEKKIVVEENKIYESILYKCELNLAKRVNRLYDTKIESYDRERIKNSLNEVEKILEISYTPLQKEAIINALTNKLSIITGGPGTGKSTILNGILNTYARLNNIAISDDVMGLKVLLVAPTGRAAKRMSETTHFKSSTIHKALGYSYDGGFTYNEHNQLGYSLIIIDEASMLDVLLANSLFAAIKNSARVILVGDSNQLPSVGPGNVLADLISTSIFKTTALNQIMRQAKDSDIITLSHMILSERISYDIFSRKKEIFYYNYDTKEAMDGIFKILDSFIKSGGDLQNGIQILIPMYAGVCGIDAVNSKIQERYNAETEKFIKRDNILFKKNDKVLQLKNDSELDIMNGDIGKIIDIVNINNKDAMLIDFDGRVVTYYASNIENLKLAYAISIHKSQGSEFENVIIPILPSYQIMLKKKIVYTGVTRAKKKLIIIGKLDSLERAIHQFDYKRQTSLYQRIELEHKNVFDNRIYDASIPFDTLGEYDMDGISPYSFM